MAKWKNFKAGYRTVPYRKSGVEKAMDFVDAIPGTIQSARAAWNTGRGIYNKAKTSLDDIMRFGHDVEQTWGKGAADKKPSTPKSRGPRSVSLEISSQSGGAVTQSYFRAAPVKGTNKIVKRIMSLGQTYKFSTAASYRLTGAAFDQQIYGDLSNSGSSFAYNDVIWGGNNPNTSSIGIFAVLKNGMPQVGLLPTIHFQTCVASTTITNNSATSCIIDLYEVVARHHNCYASTINSFTNGIYSPAAYWAQGLLDSQTATTTTGLSSPLRLAPTALAAVPTQSRYFNAYWNISKKFSITLASGASHVHNSTYILDKILPYYLYTQQGLLQGITRNQLIVARGTLGTGVTTTSYVSTMKADISVETIMRYSANQSSNSTVYVESSDPGAQDTSYKTTTIGTQTTTQ